MNNKNTILEILRGFAALMVLICHIVGKVPLVVFQTNLFFKIIGSWGTESVIVFFVLSGIVIGNSYNRKHQSTSKFLKSRLMRILPIYFMGLFLAFITEMLYYHTINYQHVSGSLFFLSTLQGYIVSPMEFNTPIWSLSFEMFFYFIFSFSFHKKHELYMLTWLIVSIICIPIYFNPLSNNGVFLHIIAMLSYSSIWLIGYYVIKYYNRFNLNFRNALLSILSLPLISRLHFNDNYYDVLKFLLFAILSTPLFCFALKSEWDSIKFNGLFYFQLFVIILCIIHLYLYSSSLLLSKIIYSSFPFCSFALFKLRFKLMRFAARLKHLFLLLGEMSYSIYILHYPIVFILIFTLKNHLLLAVVLFPLILFPFAYFIERKYQKIVVKLIRFKTN